MIKRLFYILPLTLLLAFSGACKVGESARVGKDTATILPDAEKPKYPRETNYSDECARSEPEAIIKRDVFPKTTFRLKRNKTYPYQKLGYETVDFENGDKLLIEHTGCENFTLVFHYETHRFSRATKDVQFWHETSISLVEKTVKGIEKTELPKNGLKALISHIEKSEQLRYKELVEFCKSEIGCVVSLDGVKRLENEGVEIVISFGIGPL